MSKPSETNKNSMLDGCVTKAIKTYLKDMGEQDNGQIYQLFLNEFERPLLQEVMQHVEGNQTRAAALLGVNRGTLRKKLQRYNLE